MYYWQSVKSGSIDQDLRTLQTDYHSQSQSTHGIFAYFQAMRKISGLSPENSKQIGSWSRATLKGSLVIIIVNGSLIRFFFSETEYRSHFGVQENQIVVGNVLACGEDQGQGQDGMTSLVLKAKTLFVKKSYIDECG